jgi:hypothetical protein
MLLIINIPSHINQEFGRCQKDILNNLEFLRIKINEADWGKLRSIVLNNINLTKRNVSILLDNGKAQTNR